MNPTLLGILMIGGSAAYAIAGVCISRKILHGRVREGHNDVLVPIFLNAKRREFRERYTPLVDAGW